MSNEAISKPHRTRYGMYFPVGTLVTPTLTGEIHMLVFDQYKVRLVRKICNKKNVRYYRYCLENIEEQDYPYLGFTWADDENDDIELLTPC